MRKQMETRLRFVEMLETLMRETPLEKVKVAHLCQAVGVSRATFYDHFHDIFDVPLWLWDHLMEQSLYRIGLDLDCYNAHLAKFQLLREQQEFFASAFKSDDYNSVCEHGGRMMHRLLVERAAKLLSRPLSLAETLELDFFVAGAQYMTRNWVRAGMETDPEIMAQVFCEAIPTYLRRALDQTPGALPPQNTQKASPSRH